VPDEFDEFMNLLAIMDVLNSMDRVNAHFSKRALIEEKPIEKICKEIIADEKICFKNQKDLETVERNIKIDREIFAKRIAEQRTAFEKSFETRQIAIEREIQGPNTIDRRIALEKEYMTRKREIENNLDDDNRAFEQNFTRSINTARKKLDDSIKNLNEMRAKLAPLVDIFNEANPGANLEAINGNMKELFARWIKFEERNKKKAEIEKLDMELGISKKPIEEDSISKKPIDGDDCAGPAEPAAAEPPAAATATGEENGFTHIVPDLVPITNDSTTKGINQLNQEY
jgi:hypothetical protein